MEMDLPRPSNGQVYRRTKQREGVPLDYVVEALSSACWTPWETEHLAGNGRMSTCSNLFTTVKRYGWAT